MLKKRLAGTFQTIMTEEASFPTLRQ